jgi:carboxypeptidase T
MVRTPPPAPWAPDRPGIDPDRPAWVTVAGGKGRRAPSQAGRMGPSAPARAIGGRMRRTLALMVLALGAILSMALPAAAGSDFPPGFERYHTYAEAMAELRALAAANPSIMAIERIGKSHLGRPINVVKISDRVGADEPEPEVLVLSLVHAREHLSVEQTLALAAWLVEGYGEDARATRIVDTTELWIVPQVNPDGGAYDIRNNRLHLWRKNRQPNPGHRAIGTDLNRNFDFHWGGPDSSGSPSSNNFRGTRPFSAPEAAVIRDFVASRAVDGVQQIRLGLDVHTYQKEVLYPFCFTNDPRPKEMRRGDLRILRALAGGIAARNGYEAKQASGMYLCSGTSTDWLYGAWRIYALTLELAPHTERQGGFYPKGSRVDRLVNANRDALLWFLEQAADPAGAVPSVADGDRSPVRVEYRRAS